MKILLAISDSFCANFIKGQGEYLTKQGHEVVIVSGPGVEIDKLEASEPVKVIRLPFAREISIIRDLKSLLSIIRIVKMEKPDIINAGNPKTGFLFSLARVFFWNKPLIFTLRGIRSDTLSGLKKKIVRFTERITCRFVDKVIAISPSLQEHAVDIGLVKKKKCIVLSRGSSNGVDIKYYSTTKETIKRSEELKVEYGIPDSGFKLLFVGRVTKDKGLVEVIDALDICINMRANIHLIIAGPIESGDPIPSHYYNLLRSHAHIHYLGKQIDVRPVYELGDALVLYSYREGFGNVVIEAASMGVPAIVANIPGLRDTTVDRVTGAVVEPRNAQALSKTIMDIYQHPEKRRRYGNQGKQRVLDFFGNEVVWSKQHELYLNLCKSLSPAQPVL